MAKIKNEIFYLSMIFSINKSFNKQNIFKINSINLFNHKYI